MDPGEPEESGSGVEARAGSVGNWETNELLERKFCGSEREEKRVSASLVESVK
jgi:hypothetical protein